MGNKKGLLKSILPWLIVLMVISVAIPFFNQSESSEIRYDKFIEIVQKEKVKDCKLITILDFIWRNVLLLEDDVKYCWW